ncbi:MAG: hypothetical protein PVG03_05130 [Desulfarculaceae bacterium]|jgi:uncharacterized protein YhaN
MKPVLRFEELNIRRMPGFPEGGPRLKKLASDLNIIFGPNASGKTTTALALQALIWPRLLGQKDFSVQGRFTVDQEPWSVDLYAGRCEVQRQGANRDHPVSLSGDMSDRYRLGLHELLLADNRGYEEAVLRELAGGFDLAAASEQLGFSERSPRKGTANRDLDATKAAVHEASLYQQGLVAKERDLTGLKGQLKTAESARDRLGLLERALAHVDATENFQGAQEAAAAFPEKMALLTGDEGERLDDMSQKMAQEREGQQQARTELARAQADMDSCDLPAGEVSSSLVEPLRHQVEQLERLSGDLAHKEQELAGAKEREAGYFRRLGGGVDPEKAQALDMKDLEKVARFARRAETWRNQDQACQALADWLQSKDQASDMDALKQGLFLLRRWQSENDSAPKLDVTGSLILVLAGICLALGVSLGLWVHWGFQGLSLAGVLALIWAWRRIIRPGNRGQREADFLGLGLTPPAGWTPDNVSSRIEELVEEISRAAVSQERSQRWADLETRRQRLGEERQSLDQQHRELAAQLGVTPDQDEAQLVAWVERLLHWQQVYTQVQELSASLEQGRGQLDEALAELNQKLEPLGFAPALDLVSIRGQVDDLSRRLTVYQQAVVRKENARQRLGDHDHRLTQLQNEMAQLFAKIGLSDQEEAALRSWIRMLPDYRAAADRLREAEQELARTRAGLVQHPELLEKTREELQSQYRVCQDQSSQLNEISKTIGAIESEIERAKQSHDLEEALARQDECLQNLRELRDQDYQATAGWVLAQYLEEENRDQNLPQVFHQARRLLALISNHRYQLEFDPKGPEFRVSDSRTGRGLSLAELSSATRVQLLLAVRLAFVEEQENGPRLPLLLDETLANSDEERTQAIIEAVAAISQEGRQVFYFTAREAEVNRWQEVISARPGLDWARVDLEPMPPGSIRDYSPEPSLVPEPGDLSHAQYGQVLKPPPLDPAKFHSGAVHLWYLVEDVNLLHRLLEMKIKHWGQLQTLLAHNGKPLLEGGGQALQKAQASARTLKLLASQWRIGRGRPVSKMDLVEGGVSEAFLEQVAALNQSLKGSAADLLQALEQGQIKGFRSTVKDRLRDYLEEAGCLDSRERLTREEIRLRALAGAAADIQAGLMDAGRIDRLMHWLLPEESVPEQPAEPA